jgi:hypothetical protein
MQTWGRQRFTHPPHNHDRSAALQLPGGDLPSQQPAWDMCTSPQKKSIVQLGKKFDRARRSALAGCIPVQFLLLQPRPEANKVSPRKGAGRAAAGAGCCGGPFSKRGCASAPCNGGELRGGGRGVGGRVSAGASVAHGGSVKSKAARRS